MANNAPLSESVTNIESCIQHLLQGTNVSITSDVTFKDITDILKAVGDHPKIKNVAYQMTDFRMPMGQPIPPLAQTPVEAPVETPVEVVDHAEPEEEVVEETKPEFTEAPAPVITNQAHE